MKVAEIVDGSICYILIWHRRFGVEAITSIEMGLLSTVYSLL